MDRGHERTEQVIKKIEGRLYAEYSQAAEEVQKTIDDYMQRFKLKDQKWQEWVKDGKRTDEEYAQWRKQQLMQGERWKTLKEQLAQDMVNANQSARDIATSYMPEIYEINHNYGLYQIEVGSGYQLPSSLTLYNREAIAHIAKDDPDLMPMGKNILGQIARGKAERWERQKVQSIMLQGIMQGKSNVRIAQDIAEKLANGDFKASMRYARTMSTNAQNGGRYGAYRRLERNGVPLTLQWEATLDMRTRHEHRLMHGQRRNVNEPFVVDGVEILYPAWLGSMGDYKVPPDMIWNCRCTILAWVKGFEHDALKTSERMEGLSYEEWLNAKEKPQPITKQRDIGEAMRMRYIREYGGNGSGLKKEKTFEGTGNATREQASEDWFEYENANAMAEFIRTGKMPTKDMNGVEIPDEKREQLAHEANLIQEIGEKTNTKQKTLYRGMVLSVEEARAFTPNEMYITETLTATTPKKKLATVYSDVENYGGGEGVPVIIEFQKSDGINGFKRDDEETVLPKGLTFRITRNYMDEDGVVHISLYAKKGKKKGK